MQRKSPLAAAFAAALLMASAAWAQTSTGGAQPPATKAKPKSAKAQAASGSSAAASPGEIGTQSGDRSGGKTLLGIVLERKTASGAESMPPEHVFDIGDVIRFRLKSDYNGYLYVMDQGTSGKFSTLFPASDTGSENRVVPGTDYLVPATPDGWFTVEGPAGFEVLYFLLSPTPTAPPSESRMAQQSFVAPGPASSLKPRCNDAMFKARGECMDTSAGPSALPSGAAIPAPLQPMAGSASRDIVFTKKSDETSVATKTGTDAPVIYSFRLAHH